MPMAQPGWGMNASEPIRRADGASRIEKALISVADPHTFRMPAAVIGIGNAAVFEPAARAGRRWRLVVARAVIAIGDGAADQAADDACGEAAGDRCAVIVAAVFAVGRRGWAAAVVATVIAWAIGIVLRGSGAIGCKNTAGGDQRGNSGKNYLFHRGYSISLLREIEAHYARIMARDG